MTDDDREPRSAEVTAHRMARATVELPKDPGLLAQLLALQSEIATADLSLEGVMQLVAERAAAMTGADAGVVALVDGDAMEYRAVTGTAAPHLGRRLDMHASLSGRSVLERRVLRCDDAATDPRVDRETAEAVGAVSMVCVPLMHRDDPVGALKVYSAVRRAFTDREAQALGALSAVIAAQLSHATQYERTAHASLHDALTGVGNRRAYDERLVKESAGVARYGRCLSLLLFDLDHFKAVNDEYGHSAGDEALRAVGRVLRRSRLSDDAFRVGGDEFALVLPGTRLEEARLVGGRMTDLIAAIRTPVGRLHASIGAAESSDGDPGALHDAADADLRRAKHARDGR